MSGALPKLAPLAVAVFAANKNQTRSLEEFLAPWRYQRGRRLDAGVLDDVLKLTAATIDFEALRYRFQWSQPDREGLTGVSFHPWDVPLSGLPSFLSPEGQTALTEAAQMVWAWMVSDFQKAIGEEGLEIWARPISATAPVEKIPHDVWQHFQVESWPTGQARSANGERLFSVSVAQKANAKTPRIRLSPAAESSLISELKARYQSEDPMTQGEFNRAYEELGGTRFYARELWKNEAGPYSLGRGEKASTFKLKKAAVTK